MWLSLVASHAGIAQSVEHFTRNEGVVGSSPISSFSQESVISLILVGFIALFVS